MSDITLKGRRIKGATRTSRIVEGERSCSKSRCSTLLSKYNKREFCYAHAPVRFPRVRGRVVDRTA